MRLPSIRSYYPYSSGNYGANSLLVSFETIDLYYSYETMVAFRTQKTGLVVRKNNWSSTTGKHLNVIDGGKKNGRIDGDKFEWMLWNTLSEMKLTDPKMDDSEIRSRVVSSEELRSCPKTILSPSHWIPRHKIEECGGIK